MDFERKEIFTDQEDLHYWNSIKENVAREVIERNVYQLLQTFFKENEDQEVLVLNGHDLVYSKLVDVYQEELPHIRSDFLIVNKTYTYIFILAICTDDDDLSKANEQLNETKKLLKTRYSAYLNDWRLITAVYWERNGTTPNQHVFLGKNDLKDKLKTIHQMPTAKHRFDCLLI